MVFFAAATGRLPQALAVPAVVAYNLLAFAAQPAAGWFVNTQVAGRRAALAGGVITIAALPVALLPGGMWLAIAIAGVGNAVFHVGGGVVTLLLDPGRAALPGVFVAPGAAGLAAGIALGSAPGWAWVPTAALAVALVGLALVPVGSAGSWPRRARGASLPAFTGLLLLLAVVGLRSYVGTGLPMPWKADAALLVWLTAAVVVGKAVGGALGDRYGWSRVGVGSLVLSLPLLLWATAVPLAGVVGMLLFNMTMPITLTAVVQAVPERPGFAFGLTCLALVAAALPFLLDVASGMTGSVLAGSVLLSGVLLGVALRTPRDTDRSRPTPMGQEA